MRPDEKTTNHRAALVLFLTPYISVELLSGNTPLHVYANPIAFVVGNLLYGGALLLIRETVLRWGKGLPSVLMLAAGYGMLNEGVGSKGFFDPHFYAVVGFGLEGFGRAFGINVPWAVHISIVHALYSILVPLALVGAVFPGAGRWLGDRLYAVLSVLVAADACFAFFVFQPPEHRFSPEPGPVSLIVALMGLVILAAWRLPDMRRPPGPARQRPFAAFTLGVAWAFAFIFLPGLVRRALPSPAVYVAFLLAGFVAAPVLLVFKTAEPSPAAKVALAAGLLVPWLLHGIVQVGGAGGKLAAAYVLLLLVAAAARSAARKLPPFQSGDRLN